MDVDKRDYDQHSFETMFAYPPPGWLVLVAGAALLWAGLPNTSAK